MSKFDATWDSWFPDTMKLKEALNASCDDVSELLARSEFPENVTDKYLINVLHNQRLMMRAMLFLINETDKTKA
jgi:hypothetical protein